MRHHLRLVLLGSILLAAILWGAFTPTVSQALAAPASPARTSAGASARTALTRLTQAVQVSVTIYAATAPGDSFNALCKTGVAEADIKTGGGLVLAWYKMTTHWCYNGSTVTSHQTTLSEGITTLGAFNGYSFVRFLDYHFNCYIAANSTLQCSGNHEDGKAQFHLAGTSSASDCIEYIGEDENYHGQFFPTVSHNFTFTC